MRKTFVLDTNVLLHSPAALFSFGDNKIVIPEVVLEELDKFKKENNELGSNARIVARELDKLRMKGKLNEGVQLDNGGILKVELNHSEISLPLSWPITKADNRILQVCKGLEEQGEKVYLITKDIFERIKADVVDVISKDFYDDKIPIMDEQYTGRVTVFVSEDTVNEFYKAGSIDTNKILYLNDSYQRLEENVLYQNQFVLIKSVEKPSHTAIGRHCNNKITQLRHLNKQPFGVQPRNLGQKFMQEALLTPATEAPLVIIKGPAGTAKTFYALAAGLYNILESKEKYYRKMLVCRPNIEMDEKIGFLPGSEQEKIAPLMRPMIDNLEILMDSDEEKRFEDEEELHMKVEELFDRRIITTEALAFLRGRSIVKQWVIIDEAQNLTPKQVKAIITRAGIGTKIVLIGDPDQIDHPFLDARTNGLCYAAERMKGSNLCYQVTMKEEECERSPLAQEGSSRL